MLKKKRLWLFTSMLVIFALTLAACGGGTTDDDGGDDGGGDDSGSLEGKIVTVMGAFVDTEAARFEETIKPFEEATGIDVQYEGTKEFESLLNVRVEAGDAPDMAAVPQPGLMARFAENGNLIALNSATLAGLDSNYSSAWKALGSYEGTTYGVFHRVNAKSFVWYNKPAFEAAGYETPDTWDELIALSDQMVADGNVPWCVGIESGTATGWVATDWMEDIMLRTAGPDVYDQWVNHEIPFNDASVATAAGYMAEIWLNPDYVFGGTDGILSTNFGDSPTPMFDDPPGCWMHRQGNFITGFFPDDVQEDLVNRVGVYGFPEINPEWGTPVLGGGDQFVMFEDRPEIHAFMEFLTTGESVESWAKAGGALFPHKDQNLDWYPNQIEHDLAEILVGAEVFRFDASDLMPSEVGGGTFWSEMVNYIGGKSLTDTLDAIEASWP